MSGHVKEFTKGFFRENPTFIVLLGLCPTLGTTTMVANGIGMGLGVVFVLFFSNIIISFCRKWIPASIHIPAYIVIIASLVTLLQMLLEAYVPSLYASLGVYLPLIVVNCIILGRAEAFASSHGVLDSALDGLGMGMGLTMNLTVIALIREVLGAGTITLFPMGGWNGVINVPILHTTPCRVMTLAAGALLLMGYLLPAFKALIGLMTAPKGATR